MPSEVPCKYFYFILFFIFHLSGFGDGKIEASMAFVNDYRILQWQY